MRAGSLAEGNAFSPEVGERPDRRVLGNDDRLIVAVRFDRRDIADRGAAGLREDRRGIADKAEIDAAGVDRLEQRRAELEIDPFDVDAERPESILNRMTLPDGGKKSTLLGADPDLGRFVFRPCRDGRQRCQQQRAGENGASRDHDVSFRVLPCQFKRRMRPGRLLARVDDG